jgi:hypothetical protein
MITGLPAVQSQQKCCDLRFTWPVPRLLLLLLILLSRRSQQLISGVDGSDESVVPIEKPNEGAIGIILPIKTDQPASGPDPDHMTGGGMEDKGKTASVAISIQDGSDTSVQLDQDAQAARVDSPVDSAGSGDSDTSVWLEVPVTH